MKYISLDLETTGLDKIRNQIIQIAVVVDDLTKFAPIEQLPKFTAFIKWDHLEFNPFALGMHVRSGLLTAYLGDDTKKDIGATFLALTAFLEEHYPLKEGEKYNVGGKNVASFDIPFIKALVENRFPDPTTKHIGLFVNAISHRTIDPAVYFTDFVTDKTIASLDTCKKRAGLDGMVAHDALADALDVVKVVRKIAKNNSCRWIPTNNA